jgi:hypothetical protein
MKTQKVVVRSDMYIQLKPARLLELNMLVERGSGYSPCALTRSPLPRDYNAYYDGTYALSKLSFTNLDAQNLLLKASNIVKNTEEFTSYQLEELFSTGSKTPYSTPPGTVRIFAQDLISFYNGKTWRKLDP